MAHPMSLLEAKQGAPGRASRIPVGGRVLHSRACAQPPAPAPAAPTNGKIQPQLQNLPKFQPPKFENINGTLPCPDSPGSTPREDGEEEGVPGVPSSVPSVRQCEIGSNLSTSVGEPDCSVAPVATLQPSAPETHAQEPQGWTMMSEVTMQVSAQDFKQETRCVAKEEEQPLQAAKPKRSSRAPKEGDSAPMPSARQHHQQHAVGSFVEYRSRSSGAWLLARVEGYDEKSQTYRLDVQPHAAAERVRPRQSMLDKADLQRLEAQAPARSVGSRWSGQEDTGSVAAPPRQPCSELPTTSIEPVSPRKEPRAGSKPKSLRSSRDADNNSAAYSSRQHHPQTPHVIGSFVEYRSRSSGAWLLARVEGYDEKSQTYRLDVQPHAAAERVRPRQTALDQGTEAHPPTRSVGSQWSDHEAAASGPLAAQPSLELPAPTADASSPRKDGPTALKPKRSSRAASKEAESGPVHSSRQHHQPGVHPIGSYVEYRSTRSSSAWLLARVEGYDEKTQTYHLDVQPAAAAERVRPRQTDKVDQAVEAPPPARSVGSRRSYVGQEAGSISASLNQTPPELSAPTAEPSSPRKELGRGVQPDLTTFVSQGRLPSSGSFVALPPQVRESKGSFLASAAPVAAPPAPSGLRTCAQTKPFAMVPRTGSYGARQAIADARLSAMLA